MTDKEWLEARGFEDQGYGVWRRDRVSITLGRDGATCRIFGDWDVTAVGAFGATAELAMYRAVAMLGEAHRKALAIWSEEA